MTELFQLVLLIFSDILMYGTFPVHLRFMYVLVKKRYSELDPSFQILMANITAFNILFATSQVLILEPAGQGLAPEFYTDNAFWLGRIELIKATMLTFCQIFSLFIGVNRLTAFAVPFKQSLIWSPRNAHFMCGLVWTFVLATSMPIAIGESTSYRMKISPFGVPAVEFIFLGWFDLYPQFCVFFTGGFEAAKVLIYAAIITIQMNNGSYQATFSKSVYRMTAAAAVNSLGGWSIFIFFAIYYVCQWTTGTVSYTYYSLILRVTTSFNNVLTPYVIIVSFKSLRQLFFGIRPKVGVTTFKTETSARMK